MGRPESALGWNVPLHAAGIAIASLFIWLSVKLTHPAYQSIFTNIAASFLFVVLADFIYLVQFRWRRRAFRKFFGSQSVDDPVWLVYPDFVLNPKIREAVKNLKLEEQFFYTKDKSAFSTVHRVDLPKAVADNDLRALVKIATLFGKYTGSQPQIISDSAAITSCNHSWISFGLSSNDCTHLYLQHHQKHPFFTIVQDGAASEFISCLKSDGTVRQSSRGGIAEYRRVPGSHSYGVIVRYTPDPVEDPEKVWFIVAGIGPEATVAAAEHLASCWLQLARQARYNDLLVVVETQLSSVSLVKRVDGWFFSRKRSKKNILYKILRKPKKHVPATVLK